MTFKSLSTILIFFFTPIFLWASDNNDLQTSHERKQAIKKVRRGKRKTYKIPPNPAEFSFNVSGSGFSVKVDSDSENWQPYGKRKKRKKKISNSDVAIPNTKLSFDSNKGSSDWDEYELKIELGIKKYQKRKENPTSYFKEKLKRAEKVNGLIKVILNKENLSEAKYFANLNRARECIKYYPAESDTTPSNIEEEIGLMLFPEEEKIGDFLSKEVFARPQKENIVPYQGDSKTQQEIYNNEDPLIGGWDKYEKLNPKEKLDFILLLESYVTFQDKPLPEILAQKYAHALEGLIYIFLADKQFFQQQLYPFINVLELSRRMIEQVIHTLKEHNCNTNFRNKVLYRLFQQPYRKGKKNKLINHLLNNKPNDDAGIAYQIDFIKKRNELVSKL